MWGTPNGGRPERYGRTFGYAHSQLQRTTIRRSVADGSADRHALSSGAMS